MIHYEITETMWCDPESHCVSYPVFGICILRSDTAEATLSFPDLFCDKNSAERFVGLCNELQLDESHLEYVIEDLLAGDHGFLSA